MVRRSFVCFLVQQSERDVFVMLDDGFFADPVQGWHGKSSNPSAWASHPRRTLVSKAGFIEIEIVFFFFLDLDLGGSACSNG